MYKVSELQNIKFPKEGATCSVKGKFYYRISGDEERTPDYVNCYVADSSDINSPKLFISDKFGEAIINGDETFGMIVGGEFAYYGIDVELECLIKRASQGIICEDVKALKLEKDGDSQSFFF